MCEKSYVGRHDFDMNFIGLRVFHLSLTRDVATWFTNLPTTISILGIKWKILFLVRYYEVSKKLNHKDKVNNFVALPGESVSSSWDRFTTFVRVVLNHRIEDESLKEYFIEVKMTTTKKCLILLWVNPMGNAHMKRLYRCWERCLETIKVWALETMSELW